METLGIWHFHVFSTCFSALLLGSRLKVVSAAGKALHELLLSRLLCSPSGVISTSLLSVCQDVVGFVEHLELLGVSALVRMLCQDFGSEFGPVGEKKIGTLSFCLSGTYATGNQQIFIPIIRIVLSSWYGFDPSLPDFMQGRIPVHTNELVIIWFRHCDVTKPVGTDRFSVTLNFQQPQQESRWKGQLWYTMTHDQTRQDDLWAIST